MNKPKTLNGFYNKFDAYEMICYPGQEQFFFGRESKGPGAYLPMEFIALSPAKNPLKYSVPK